MRLTNEGVLCKIPYVELFDGNNLRISLQFSGFKSITGKKEELLCLMIYEQ